MTSGSTAKEPRTLKCPNCTRTFRQPNDVVNHINSKHGGRRREQFRDDDEPSFADRAVEASIAVACGLPTDDDLLLP
jgi:hypothetical protein